MKFVQKGEQPHKYRAWCREVQGTNNEDYREMPGTVKSVLLAALINEQGGICAYTMKRIDNNTSHIEHVCPESLCRSDKKGSDLEFLNMLACFPRDGMLHSYRYGAQKKADWWKPALFISPLNPACEKMFRFTRDGAISAVRSNKAASCTIKILALDHATLTEDRHRAIYEFIYGKNGTDPLSKAMASRILEKVCNRSSGRFIEFCMALRDALNDHVKYVEKLERKRTFAKRKTQ